jgi:endo-1,4-beta-mannosidase
VAAGAVLGGLPESIFGAEPDERFMRHRFGVNYVPSRKWYYCWNDWHAEDIARDFDRIAEVGADHIRIMLVWPWFQPNQAVVSSAHLDRLEELMHLAAKRKLDVLVTLYNGWLSGIRFVPEYLKRLHLDTESFYSSPKWQAIQDLFLVEVSKRVVTHKNFLGFDIANEIDCCWPCEPAEGDPWMARVFKRMNELCPGRVHVNGADHNPWFKVTTFSPEAMASQQKIVPLHAYPYWAEASKHTKPGEIPYAELPAAMAALERCYGKAPRKPIWLQEFGASSIEMLRADVPKWLEQAVTAGVAEGVSWFTWWASHDIERKFDFHPFEYDLGLVTADNQIKEQGHMFKRLADTYRGKQVVIPKKAFPAPPTERTFDTAWQWMFEYMEWKK